MECRSCDDRLKPPPLRGQFSSTVDTNQALCATYVAVCGETVAGGVTSPRGAHTWHRNFTSGCSHQDRLGVGADQVIAVAACRNRPDGERPSPRSMRKRESRRPQVGVLAAELCRHVLHCRGREPAPGTPTRRVVAEGALLAK